jgi:hypothetical protein
VEAEAQRGGGSVASLRFGLLHPMGPSNGLARKNRLARRCRTLR